MNVLTLTSTPETLLARLREYAEVAMARLLSRIDETERRWRQRSGEQNWQEHNQRRTGVVLSYADLHAETVQRLGQERVTAEFVAEWQRWPAQLDVRERSMRLVYRLWSLSHRQGPAVILFYTPPYYPAVAPVPGPLLDAVKSVMVAHPEIQLELRPYFPYLSDMSYLHLDAGTDLSMLIANMPAWQEERSIFPGAYRLPLTVIEDLNIPVVNWGPFGRGAHQRDEGVLMSYSFEALPQLLFETIHCLAE